MGKMRITGGEARGRIINAPLGLDVRPTASKIRQAFFNILASNLTECSFLDLFAGSGLMGIEALSRNAEVVIFVEERKDFVENIKANLKHLRYEKRSQVIQSDVQSALSTLQPHTFDVIFADPPYKSQLQLLVLNTVSNLSLLKTTGILAIEHACEYELPESSGSLSKADTRKYGRGAISFYRPQEGA